MTTKPMMLAAFAELSNAGLPQPAQWRAAATEADVKAAKMRSTEAYLRATERFTDEQLAAAVRAYIDSGAQYWPAVGQLIGLMPRRKPSTQLALTAKGQGCAMDVAHKMPRELQVEMLEEYRNGPDGETNDMIWERMNLFLERRCGELGVDWRTIEA